MLTKFEIKDPNSTSMNAVHSQEKLQLVKAGQKLVGNL